MLIIQREVIPGTVIDVVHEAVHGHRGFRVVGLQWDGNSGDRIADGKEIRRSLGTVVRAADDNPVIALGIIILHPKGERFSGA